ncbi:MAG: hypothetical protein JOY69_01705 [Candidatus Eremiobacteraeota bacterium]|nr:hypothetical protein [Candidatus Eremiobacteraeota bacterium]MBV8371951.1 hypothetical protein [Candidatus Eremiobacteraeota bacterium]
MKHPALVALGCTLFALGLAIAPLPSTAQTSPAPTPVPIPHPDFTAMKYLIGTWQCTQPLRGKMRPETDVYTMSQDGMWMVEQSTAPPFDQYRTVPQNGMGYLTYDPTVKMWVTTGIDSLGGYGLQSASGWQGNTITWSGKGLDGTTFTDVITKVSDTKTTDDNTTTDPQGKVTKVTITCTKSAS